MQRREDAKASGGSRPLCAFASLREIFGRLRRTGGRELPLRAWPQMKTGPVFPPAPSQVPAGAFRPRSVPNRVLQEQAPAGPDPGRPKQAPNRPFRRPRGKPRFRLADVFPANRRPSSNVFPASRRPFVGRPSGKPATFPGTSFRQAGDCPLRLFSTGRTRLPDLWILSGRTLRFSSGRPFEQALRAAFRGSFARRLRFRRTPGKWVRLWVSPPPRASSRLPHQSVPGLLPEGSRPDRHWRRLGSPNRCRPVLLDRERPTWRPEVIRAKPNHEILPVDNEDNEDNFLLSLGMVLLFCFFNRLISPASEGAKTGKEPASSTEGKQNRIIN